MHEQHCHIARIRICIQGAVIQGAVIQGAVACCTLIQALAFELERYAAAPSDFSALA